MLSLGNYIIIIGVRHRPNREKAAAAAADSIVIEHRPMESKELEHNFQMQHKSLQTDATRCLQPAMDTQPTQHQYLKIGNLQKHIAAKAIMITGRVRIPASSDQT